MYCVRPPKALKPVATYALDCLPDSPSLPPSILSAFVACPDFFFGICDFPIFPIQVTRRLRCPTMVAVAQTDIRHGDS